GFPPPPRGAAQTSDRWAPPKKRGGPPPPPAAGRGVLGSGGPAFLGSSTSAARDLMRWSTLLPELLLPASRNCQPRSWHAACQIFESPPSRTRRAVLGACAAAGRTSRTANTSRRDRRDHSLTVVARQVAANTWARF